MITAYREINVATSLFDFGRGVGNQYCPNLFACPMQEIAVEYNDTVIYPDKVRINQYQ